MRNSRLTAALGLIALPLSPVSAQTPFVLDEIVVDAGLLPSAQSRTGATVEVIDGTEVQAAGPSAARVLGTLPGISLSSTGGLGANTGITMRGLSQTYIGVQIDGIEVTDPSSTQTAFGFGTLVSAPIGQITVLKGSQSAIYGSEAVAGVVDIKSWRPDQPGVSGRALIEAGTFNTYSGSASIGFLDDETEIALTFSHIRTDGFSARSSDDEDDGFEQTGINLFAARQISGDVRVGLSAIWSDGTTEFDRSTADPSGEADETRKGARLFSEIRTGGVTHELAFSGYEIERFDAGGFTQLFIGERLKAEYLGTAEISPETTLAFGADWTEEKATLDASEFEIDNTAVFGEVQYAPSGNLDLSLSARYDDHSEFGGQGSGRAALSWRPAEDTILRAALGYGYRAPSLYELFGPFGSPTLTPETSLSAEIGIERSFNGRGSVRGTLFYIEIDDLIDFDFGTFAYAQTPGTTTTQGIEIAGQYRVSDMIEVFGNYTYTEAETEGQRRIRVPRHNLLMGFDADVTDRLSAGAQVQFVKDTLDGFGTPTPLDDYALVGLNFAYRVSDGAEAYLRVENLLDEEYETVRGFNTSGQAFFAGLRATF